ncbi:MAG: hypothetical protein K6T73_00855, partial [Candidatus Bathyarchaeota archaeon]|nr:hypothetical protein [Candidatus Bathyarchaeota archaeon]
LGHVGKEFSGVAILLIFIILMTNFAFSPQSGGIPKVYSQAYSPVTITGGSLPIIPNQPVQEWLDMLDWLKSNVGYNPIEEKVVCSWWDYGYWLTILGNVTSLADNATINGTQIENVGFIFMANETQAVEMLKRYNAKYVLVFITLAIKQEGNQYYASWAGYGDEGKWMWIARISGKASQRFKNEGLLNDATAWTDEFKFGNYSSSKKWQWNDFGTNSTIYKLMSWGRQRWCDAHSDTGILPEEPGIEPKYFKEAYFAGVNVAPDKYGGIIPLICLYEIKYPD